MTGRNGADMHFKCVTLRFTRWLLQVLIFELNARTQLPMLCY